MPDPSRPDDPTLPWWQRLATMKVTPLVVLVFFCALAAMSGAAALVGHWAHGLKHAATQQGR